MSGLEKKEPSKETALKNVAALLSYYFDLGTDIPELLIDRWLEQYPATWVRLATIEALYQGRYRAVSVTQILEVWHRRDRVLKHFSYDFELLVCGNLPETLLESTAEKEIEVQNPAPEASDPSENSIAQMSGDADTAASEFVLDENPLHPAIHQFMPVADRSEFYTRLKSIAEHSRQKEDVSEEEE
jgi:hypothetical protein